MTDDPWIRVQDLEPDNPLRILAEDILGYRSVTLEEAQGAIADAYPHAERDTIEVVITADTSGFRRAMASVARGSGAQYPWMFERAMRAAVEFEQEQQRLTAVLAGASNVLGPIYDEMQRISPRVWRRIDRWSRPRHQRAQRRATCPVPFKRNARKYGR